MWGPSLQLPRESPTFCRASGWCTQPQEPVWPYGPWQTFKCKPRSTSSQRGDKQSSPACPERAVLRWAGHCSSEALVSTAVALLNNACTWTGLLLAPVPHTLSQESLLQNKLSTLKLLSHPVFFRGNPGRPSFVVINSDIALHFKTACTSMNLCDH